jgi:hypothetical protein
MEDRQHVLKFKDRADKILMKYSGLAGWKMKIDKIYSFICEYEKMKSTNL